jgi:Mce-associated membrane protein
MTEEQDVSQAEPAATPAVETPAAAPARATRGPRLAWSVAAFTTILAIAFAVAWAPLYSEAKDRERVREAAEQLVLHLTTFEGATIDEWVQDTQRRATDDYAEEVNTLFDPELRGALRDAKAKSVGRLVNLFVQDVDGENALVFAVVRQTITNAASPEPVEDELRMQIELRQVDGDWKAAKVEVLGQQGSGSALVDEAGEAP